MFANERYAIILDRIQKNGAVTVSELTELLKISTETVRRDLLYLEKQKKLQRVHGGAVVLNAMKKFPDLSERLQENRDKKQQISLTAMQFIKDGDIIIIDSGSTSKEFASVLKNRFHNLTIITHSPHVFEELKGAEGYKLILIGGEYMPKEDAFYGTLVLESIGKLHATTCFLFPSAVSLKYGVADFVPELVAVQKSYMNISNNVVIMADSSKYEKTALIKLCDTNSRPVFITSNDLDEGIYELYKSHEIQIFKNGEKQ